MSVNLVDNELEVAGNIVTDRTGMDFQTEPSEKNDFGSTRKDVVVGDGPSGSFVSDVENAVALLHGESGYGMENVEVIESQTEQTQEAVGEVAPLSPENSMPVNQPMDDMVAFLDGRSGDQIDIINEVVSGQPGEEVIETGLVQTEQNVSIDEAVEQAVALLHSDSPQAFVSEISNTDLSMEEEEVPQSSVTSVEEAVAVLHAENLEDTPIANEITLEESKLVTPTSSLLPSEDAVGAKQLNVIPKPISSNLSCITNVASQDKSKAQKIYKIMVSQNPSSKKPVKIISKVAAPQYLLNSVAASSKVTATHLPGHDSQFHLPVYSIGDNNVLKIDGHQNVFVMDNDNSLKVGNVVEPKTVPGPHKIIRRKKEEEAIPPLLNDELKQAFRIMRDLWSDKAKNVNWPFLDPVNSGWPEAADYAQVIQKPMWLKKIRSNFQEKKYESITEPISDLRLMIENCYRYNGPDHPLSKKAIKIETMLEQKLALLSREYRDKTSLEVTSGEITEEDQAGGQKRKLSRTLAEGGQSQLLERVRHEKALRDKELKLKRIEEKKAEKEAAYQKALDWENTLLSEANIQEMKAMWELPQIGHFLYLTQAALNIPEISQFELERILLMPRQSSTLPIIMTSLLANPNARANLDKRPSMKYKIWQQKLKQRVVKWYRILRSKSNQPLSVFEQVGVEPAFFAVMGLVNPFDSKEFHELTFHQRIWLLKSLCDYCLHTHKTIQEIIGEQNLVDQKEVILGSDMNGCIYIHFPQFCGQDLRIYKQLGWVPPSIDVPIVNTRKQKAPVTRVERKPPDVVPKKPDEPSVAAVPHQRPSNLRQTLKPVRHHDMICEGIGSTHNGNSESDRNDQEYVPSEAINVAEVEVGEDKEATVETEISSSSVAEDDTFKDQNTEPEPPVAPMEELEPPEPEEKVKSELKPEEETEKVKTDLSKSIVDFDLEKELAISIRGRSGRKQQKPGEKKRGRKSKKGSEDTKDKNVESDETDSTKLKDDDEKESVPKIKTEVTDEHEQEEQDDHTPHTLNDSIKSELADGVEKEEKVDVKIEPEPTEEIINSFELNVREYISATKYELPNTDNFELVVDGIEALKGLIDKLIKEEDFHTKDAKGRQRAPRFSRVQKNELQLRERLCNLLEELEPWKEKLSQAVKRSVQRLKKEWDEYDPKSEEITGQDEWESESDDEKSVQSTPKLSEKESEAEEDGTADISQRLKTRHLKAALKKKKKIQEAADAKEAALTVSSRGRVRRVRNKKDDIYDYGDDEAEAAQKDLDKSDNFKPDSAKRKAHKEVAMNDGDQKDSEQTDESPKKSRGSSKKRQVYTIEDGVLKAVNISDLSGKQIIRKKSTNNIGVLKKPKVNPNSTEPVVIAPAPNAPGGEGSNILRIGGKSILIPNSKDDPNAVRVLSVGGKTLLVKGQHVAVLNSQSNEIKPTDNDVKPVVQAPSPAIANDTPFVQLHNASGHVQKVISLPDAQKLLVASKKSPISMAGGVKPSVDGTVMVPVVDSEGKVCYLKMKKNTPSNTDSGNIPAVAKPEGPQIISQETPPGQSNILRSIIQSEIGDLNKTNAINAKEKPKASRKKVLKTVQVKRPPKGGEKVLFAGEQLDRLQQPIPNVTNILNLNAIPKALNQNSVLSIPINQLNQQNSIFKLTSQQGNNVLVQLPKSDVLPSKTQANQRKKPIAPKGIRSLTTQPTSTANEAAAAVQNLLSSDFDNFSSEPVPMAPEQLKHTESVANPVVSMPTIPMSSLSSVSATNSVKLTSIQSLTASGSSVSTLTNVSSNPTSILQTNPALVKSNTSSVAAGTPKVIRVIQSPTAVINNSCQLSTLNPNTPIKTVATPQPSPASPGKFKVMIQRGDQMVPVLINSESLAGLSGGSYFLDVKTGRLQPVAPKTVVTKSNNESLNK